MKSGGISVQFKKMLVELVLNPSVIFGGKLGT